MTKKKSVHEYLLLISCLFWTICW